MMTESLQVSILAAPLGAIDRRTLSQAWYSALHIAQSDEPRTIPQRDRAGTGATVQRPEIFDERAPRSHGDSSKVAGDARGRRGAASLGAPNGPAARSRSPLAVQIERRFGAAKPRVKRATFAVGRGEARVHVILQTSGNRATLLALCRPEMQTAVARALTQARIALAERGIALDLASNRGVRCS
jgi:hypothetical protein